MNVRSLLPQPCRGCHLSREAAYAAQMGTCQPAIILPAEASGSECRRLCGRAGTALVEENAKRRAAAVLALAAAKGQLGLFVLNWITSGFQDVAYESRREQKAATVAGNMKIDPTAHMAAVSAIRLRFRFANPPSELLADIGPPHILGTAQVQLGDGEVG